MVVISVQSISKSNYLNQFTSHSNNFVNQCIMACKKWPQLMSHHVSAYKPSHVITYVDCRKPLEIISNTNRSKNIWITYYTQLSSWILSTEIFERLLHPWNNCQTIISFQGMREKVQMQSHKEAEGRRKGPGSTTSVNNKKRCHTDTYILD